MKIKRKSGQINFYRNSGVHLGTVTPHQFSAAYRHNDGNYSAVLFAFSDFRVGLQIKHRTIFDFWLFGKQKRSI